MEHWVRQDTKYIIDCRLLTNNHCRIFVRFQYFCYRLWHLSRQKQAQIHIQNVMFVTKKSLFISTLYTTNSMAATCIIHATWKYKIPLLWYSNKSIIIWVLEIIKTQLYIRHCQCKMCSSQQGGYVYNGITSSSLCTVLQNFNLLHIRVIRLITKKNHFFFCNN